LTNGEWKLQRRGFPSLPKQTYKVEKKERYKKERSKKDKGLKKEERRRE